MKYLLAALIATVPLLAHPFDKYTPDNEPQLWEEIDDIHISIFSLKNRLERMEQKIDEMNDMLRYMDSQLFVERFTGDT